MKMETQVQEVQSIRTTKEMQVLRNQPINQHQTNQIRRRKVVRLGLK